MHRKPKEVGPLENSLHIELVLHFEYFPSMCRDSLMYTLKFPLVEEGVA